MRTDLGALAIAIALGAGCAHQKAAETAPPPPAEKATAAPAEKDAAHPAATAPTGAAALAAWSKGAQLFDDLGSLHRAVTTSSPEAQAYFDQGLRLTYGFNHDEATRSFARAAEIDPSCAS